MIKTIDDLICRLIQSIKNNTKLYHKQNQEDDYSKIEGKIKGLEIALYFVMQLKEYMQDNEGEK